MPNIPGEYKSPYAKRPYTTSRNHNKKSDRPYLELEDMTAFARFELREKNIHDAYLAAASSGDHEMSALLASVYRKHHASRK